ncbi:MAG: OmpA family protein [Deltaproteobacteria bacterium]|nr:OmpA family protein [Deltaproteobacteria bacterium]
MPNAFPSTRRSGFDIQSFCFSYDPGNDTLYIGIQTFNDSSGRPVIFGDAEGDGDPGSADATLQGLGGQDLPNLSGSEFITLAIDFNRDGATDLVVGVNTGNKLADFAVVGGVGGSDNDLQYAPSPKFYGAALGGVIVASPVSPSNAKPHFEFAVSGLSNSPRFSSLNFNDPDSYFQLYLAAGSLADDGISDDAFPYNLTYQKMKVDTLRDTDGDGIPDAFDTDNDNDGIPDLVEKNLSQYDTNGDGVLSSAEITASGKDVDGDGDIDTNDGIVWPDTDGDSIPDYLDTDSDGDGIPDSLEAGSPSGTRDSDGDGISDFRETDSDGDGILDNVEDANKNGVVDSGESNPTKADTDGDGLCDGTIVVGSCTGAEGLKGTDPRKADTDGDGLCDGSIVVAPCVQSEGNLKTDPTKADTDGDGIPDGIEYLNGRNPLVAEIGNLLAPTLEPTLPPPSSTSSTGSGATTTTLAGDQLQGAGIGCQMTPGAGSFGGMLFWWLFLIFSLGVVPRVWGLNVDHLRADSDGMGFPNIESAKTLHKEDFSLGLLQTIVHNPLKLGQSSTGNAADSVVNYFYVWDLWGAYGIFDNLDVGINFPVSLLSQVKDIGTTNKRNTSSVGDIRLQSKWHFLEADQNILRAQLSLLTFLNLPSGNTNDFFGDGSVSGGVKVIGERHFGKHEVFLNLGANARGKNNVTVSNTKLIEVGPEMLWGAGWRWPFSVVHQWVVQSGFWGKTDFSSAITSPTEWDATVAKRFDKQPIEASLGFGLGLGSGYGAPDYRIIMGVNYVPGSEGRTMDHGPRTVDLKPAPTSQAKLEGKKIVVLRPIHFEVNRAVIRQESLPILNDVAHLLDQNRTILRVRIEGHTDNDGSDKFNTRLSEERTKAVKDYLVKKGIAPSRLETKGWGEKQPVVPNDTPQHKAQNRRVEFHVIEVEK